MKYLLAWDTPDIPERFFNDVEARDNFLREYIAIDPEIISFAIIDTESPNTMIQTVRLLKLMALIVREYDK